MRLTPAGVLFFTNLLSTIELKLSLLVSYHRLWRRNPIIAIGTRPRAKFLARHMQIDTLSTVKLEKPVIDDCKYELFTLQNGIRVTLVSDKTSEKSSAALAVRIGAAADTLPGLAHITEHAVFLGSEKYPAENEYKKYLSKNGGGKTMALLYMSLYLI